MSAIFSNPNIESTVNGSGIFSHQNQNDFFADLDATSIYIDLKDKKEIFQKLNILTRDEKDTKSLAEAFRLIGQSSAISHQEKVKWLTENNALLPPPFLFLNALFMSVLPNHEKLAREWCAFAYLRCTIDENKCMDYSVASGTSQLTTFIFPLLQLEDFQKEYGIAFFRLIDTYLESALQLHKKYPTKTKIPYWLINHGMRAFLREEVSSPGKDFSVVKNPSSWGKLEMESIEQLKLLKNQALETIAQIRNELAENQQYLQSLPEEERLEYQNFTENYNAQKTALIQKRAKKYLGENFKKNEPMMLSRDGHNASAATLSNSSLSASSSPSSNDSASTYSARNDTAK